MIVMRLGRCKKCCSRSNNPEGQVYPPLAAPKATRAPACPGNVEVAPPAHARGYSISEQVLVRRLAFTLIELLVVIGIIAILAAILVPAVQSSFKKGQRVTAQGDVIKIVNGWKSFYNEYGRWPTNGQENIVTGQAMNAHFVGILTTRYYENMKDNPKNIKFMEVTAEQLDASTNIFLDPWGTPYRVMFDTNFNGRIERQSFAAVYDTVIAWSAGPDTLTTVAADMADDVKSWE